MSKRILVTKSSMPDFEEFCEEIKELWDTHWLTNMGVKHKQLQMELEEYLESYKKAGYPMVSHSQRYRDAYKPAYRIVLLRVLPEELTIGMKHI